MRKASRVLAGAASLAILSPLERTVQAQPSFPLNNLTRYYNFDEGQGIFANDLTGTHGLTVSDSWTLQGKLNAAYNPNGNSYDTTHNPFGQEGVSVNFWIKKTGVWEPHRDIIGTGNEGGRFYIDTYNDDLLFFLWPGTAPHITFPNDGKYHMVALTMKDGEQKGYLDGAPKFTTNLPYSFSNNPVRLFGGLGGGAPNNVMNVDEVGIWSRVISDNDISALYNNGQGLSCPLPEPSTIALTVGGAALLAPRRRKSN